MREIVIKSSKQDESKFDDSEIIDTISTKIYFLCRPGNDLYVVKWIRWKRSRKCEIKGLEKETLEGTLATSTYLFNFSSI